MRVLAVLSVLVLAACAGPATAPPRGTGAQMDAEMALQHRMALEKQIAEERPLQTLYWPLVVHNAPLCEKTAPDIGARVWSTALFEGERQAAAREALGVTDALSVFLVYPDSPAALAGLRAGDVVRSVAGTPIPQGEAGLKAWGKAMEDLSAGQPTSVALDRAGQALTVQIAPVQVCAYPLVYNPHAQAVNAAATGSGVIVVNRGLVRFAEDDQEIALVLAHELAHHAADHLDKQMQNAMVPGILGAVLDGMAVGAGVNTGGLFTGLAMQAGAGKYSVEFEREADYIGMYMLARAGYDTAGAADFWRRMAVEVMAGPRSHATTHPTTQDRFLAIEAAHAEIEAKRRAGQPLEPNYVE